MNTKHVPRPSAAQRLGQRSLDLVGAATLLLVTLPIWPLIAAAVKLTSRGPILFRQTRIGLGGKEFAMLKFRTMLEGTDSFVRSDPAVWKAYVANDHKLPAEFNRFTPVGRKLRRWSLDEFPQLINVLRGDMSLVGVRPIEATQLAEREAKSRALYTSLRPGLTGLWQVEGRATVRSAERATLDDHYVCTRSLLGDMALLCRTPLAVLRPTQHKHW